MNFRTYTQGLIDIVDRHSKRPNVMVGKVIEYYDAVTQNQRLKKAQIYSYYKVTKKKLLEITNRFKLSSSSLIRIEVFEI